LKESSDWRTPLALLAGKANLSALCRKVEEVSGGAALGNTPGGAQTAEGHALLRCTPRDAEEAGSAATQVLLETDSEGRLVRVVIREAGNAETEFRFGGWEENIPIPEAKFHFQPPPGVAIVDQQSLGEALR